MNLKLIISRIAPDIKFLEVISKGSYAEVAKVEKDQMVYAMKGQKLPFIHPIDYEFHVQRSLHGLAGIPEAVKLYEKGFLMEYVEGRLLCCAGRQDKRFFSRLQGIVDGIVGRGYYLGRDFGSTNIIVGNSGDPWVIDFYFYSPKPQELDNRSDAKLKVKELEQAFML